MFYKVFSLHIFAKFSSNNNYFHQPGVLANFGIWSSSPVTYSRHTALTQNKAEIS